MKFVFTFKKKYTNESLRIKSKQHYYIIVKLEKSEAMFLCCCCCFSCVWVCVFVFVFGSVCVLYMKLWRKKLTRLFTWRCDSFLKLLCNQNSKWYGKLDCVSGLFLEHFAATLNKHLSIIEWPYAMQKCGQSDFGRDFPMQFDGGGG